MKLSRRNFLKGSAAVGAATMFPLAASASMIRDFTPSAPYTPEPALVRQLNGCLLFEFESRQFDHALSHVSHWSRINKRETGNGWYLQDGDTVWALSGYYQTPVNGSIRSSFPMSLNYSAKSIVHMTDHTVWKSREALSFREIVARAPASVARLSVFE